MSRPDLPHVETSLPELTLRDEFDDHLAAYLSDRLTEHNLEVTGIRDGRGLTVVGIPSRSFGQELESAQAVKEFCEMNFAIDFPMTGLVEVKGKGPVETWHLVGPAS